MVKNASEKKKMGKAACLSTTGAHMMKVPSGVAVKMLAELTYSMIRKSRFPDNWLRSVITSYHKNKGDGLEWGNYKVLKMFYREERVTQNLRNS